MGYVGHKILPDIFQADDIGNILDHHEKSNGLLRIAWADGIGVDPIDPPAAVLLEFCVYPAKLLFCHGVLRHTIQVIMANKLV